MADTPPVAPSQEPTVAVSPASATSAPSLKAAVATAEAVVTPTIKAAESTAIAAVRADVSSVWTKVRPYLISAALVAAAFFVGHFVK